MHARSLIGALALVALAAGCKGQDGPTADAAVGRLVLHLDHFAGGEPLVLHTGSATNAAGNTYTTTLLEYVISNIALVRSDGTFTTDKLHYRNAADPATRSVEIDGVPAGTYVGLRFTFGIPGDQNRSGAWPELDRAGMAWPAQMGGGYHAMRHEGRFGDGHAFATHLGPSGGQDHSVVVQIPLIDWQLKAGERTPLTIGMELNNWYAGPNVYDLTGKGGIMGKPAHQKTLAGNGGDVWRRVP